jgi:Fe-S-cluster containining protein
MLADHDALLSDWKKNAARRKDTSFRFLRSLKMVADPEEIDELAQELHGEVFARIDCTRCANCCKTMPPGLNDEDIERIAAQQKMPRQEFIEAYLQAAPENPGRLLMTGIPCPFLGADDRCTIYDIRPESCRKFPHTDQEGFTCRSSQHTSNTLNCPAVYHIVQEMRKAMRGRKNR